MLKIMPMRAFASAHQAWKNGDKETRRKIQGSFWVQKVLELGFRLGEIEDDEEE